MKTGHDIDQHANACQSDVYGCTDASAYNYDPMQLLMMVVVLIL